MRSYHTQMEAHGMLTQQVDLLCLSWMVDWEHLWGARGACPIYCLSLSPVPITRNCSLYSIDSIWYHFASWLFLKYPNPYRPKSAITVRDGLTFLDLAVRQVEVGLCFFISLQLLLLQIPSLESMLPFYVSQLRVTLLSLPLKFETKLDILFTHTCYNPFRLPFEWQ